MNQRAPHKTSIWIFPFNRVTKTILVVGLLLFTAMAIIAFGTGNQFDEHVFSSIPHNSVFITDFMHGITKLGNTEVMIVANCLLVVFLLINKENKTALEIAIVASSSVLVMSLLKRLFHRHRPPHPLIEGITNYSFPSGHAFMSMAFYGLMMWWATIHLKEKWQQRLAITGFALLILIIGFSRIYLRVHYTTDVIAGISFSAAWLVIALTITDRFIKRPYWKRDTYFR